MERVRLIGVIWQLNSLDTLLKLAKLKGLDVNGVNTEKAVITGKCHVLVATSVKLAEVQAAFPELTITYTQLKPETVTTFVFSSSQSKSITNAVFECNFDFVMVSQTTYKITAQDNETIFFSFKCDNHEVYNNSYLVAGTRTQNFSVTYIPLRTIRVKVYGKSVYPQGATVTINGKKLTSDANGYVTYRGGEAVSGEVSAFGYAGNTFSFSAITNDTSNTIEVYEAVEVKFVLKSSIDTSTLIQGAVIQCGDVQGITNLYGECTLLLGKGTYDYTITHEEYFEKSGSVSVGTSSSTVNVSLDPAKVTVKFIVKDKGGLLVDGVNITCNGDTGITNENGECELRVDSKQKHAYTAVKYGYFDFTGELSVTLSPVSLNISMLFNAELFKPDENDNIQMFLQGTDAVLVIDSTTSDYVIDWGDGVLDNASGVGSKTYNHTYATSGKYQVEIKNCKNITKCNGNSACLVAYWSIGNSKVSSLNFGNLKNLSCVGSNIFKNDKTRDSFNSCFSNCSNLTSIPAELFGSCTKALDFSNCFSNCSNLKSIPTGLFDNCTAMYRLERCFYHCDALTTIPAGLFDNCTEMIYFSECFYYCINITTIPSGLFDNCTKVKYFYGCFQYCKNLTTIPSGPI